MRIACALASLMLCVEKRAFRGDPAQLVYLCEMTGQLIRRQIFMRFEDAAAAEAAFNRQVSALIDELGHPCIAISEGAADSKDIPGYPGTRRTIVWNISADYNAIAFAFSASILPALAGPTSIQFAARYGVVERIAGHLARSRMYLARSKRA